MIIEDIKKKINQVLNDLNFPIVDYSVDKSKYVAHGDLNTNVAMVLRKNPACASLTPFEIAEKIVNKLDKNDFEMIEIVKPGFINFFLKAESTNELIHEINKQKDDYPHFDKIDEIISVEFVSANPTGYLHIGHARNATLGEVISKLYEKVGYTVIRDYVVNDAGNQMNLLASSVLTRYKQLFNLPIELPEDSYHGEEIKLVAASLKEQYGDKFIDVKTNENFIIEDDEKRKFIRNFARNYLLEQIKHDLLELGVKLDVYYSEQQTHDENRFPEIIEKLGDNVYKKDGATWLKTTKYGDDKDRVLIKSDGAVTYFFPDIYYH